MLLNWFPLMQVINVWQLSVGKRWTPSGGHSNGISVVVPGAPEVPAVGGEFVETVDGGGVTGAKVVVVVVTVVVVVVDSVGGGVMAVGTPYWASKNPNKFKITNVWNFLIFLSLLNAANSLPGSFILPSMALKQCRSRMTIANWCSSKFDNDWLECQAMNAQKVEFCKRRVWYELKHVFGQLLIRLCNSIWKREGGKL